MKTITINALRIFVMDDYKVFLDWREWEPYHPTFTNIYINRKPYGSADYTILDTLASSAEYYLDTTIPSAGTWSYTISGVTATSSYVLTGNPYVDGFGYNYYVPFIEPSLEILPKWTQATNRVANVNDLTTDEVADLIPQVKTNQEVVYTPPAYRQDASEVVSGDRKWTWNNKWVGPSDSGITNVTTTTSSVTYTLTTTETVVEDRIYSDAIRSMMGFVTSTVGSASSSVTTYLDYPTPSGGTALTLGISADPSWKTSLTAAAVGNMLATWNGSTYSASASIASIYASSSIKLHVSGSSEYIVLYGYPSTLGTHSAWSAYTFSDSEDAQAFYDSIASSGDAWDEATAPTSGIEAASIAFGLAPGDALRTTLADVALGDYIWGWAGDRWVTGSTIAVSALLATDDTRGRAIFQTTIPNRYTVVCSALEILEGHATSGRAYNAYYFVDLDPAAKFYHSIGSSGDENLFSLKSSRISMTVEPLAITIGPSSFPAAAYSGTSGTVAITTPATGWITSAMEGAQWLGLKANVETSGDLSGGYSFNTTFDIPDGLSGGTFLCAFTADDHIGVRLNGSELGYSGDGTYVYDPFYYQSIWTCSSTGISGGTNQLKFYVYNQSEGTTGNPVAIKFQSYVSFTGETSSSSTTTWTSGSLGTDVIGFSQDPDLTVINYQSTSPGGLVGGTYYQSNLEEPMIRRWVISSSFPARRAYDSLKQVATTKTNFDYAVDSYVWFARIPVESNSQGIVTIVTSAHTISATRSLTERDFWSAKDPVWYPGNYLEPQPYNIALIEPPLFIYIRNLDSTSTIASCAITLSSITQDSAVYYNKYTEPFDILPDYFKCGVISPRSFITTGSSAYITLPSSAHALTLYYKDSNLLSECRVSGSTVTYNKKTENLEYRDLRNALDDIAELMGVYRLKYESNRELNTRIQLANRAPKGVTSDSLPYMIGLELGLIDKVEWTGLSTLSLVGSSVLAVHIDELDEHNYYHMYPLTYSGTSGTYYSYTKGWDSNYKVYVNDVLATTYNYPSLVVSSGDVNLGTTLDAIVKASFSTTNYTTSSSGGYVVSIIPSALTSGSYKVVLLKDVTAWSVIDEDEISVNALAIDDVYSQNLHSIKDYVGIVSPLLLGQADWSKQTTWFMEHDDKPVITPIPWRFK